MAVLTEQEQTAARLLLSAFIGFLAAEDPMDEQSFPLMMELLNCMEGEKEDGCQDAVESLLEDAVRNTHRHEEYYSNYQRYQLLQENRSGQIRADGLLPVPGPSKQPSFSPHLAKSYLPQYPPP